MQGMGYGQSGSGRLLGGLQDQGATSGQGAGDLARGRQRRKIPGGEGGGRADRLQQHHLANLGIAARNDAAIGPASLLRTPVKDLRRVQGFALGLRQWLALLQGHDLGDGVPPLADQVGAAREDLAALESRGAPPGLEGARGGRNRPVQVIRRRMRQFGQGLTGRRIDHRLSDPPFAGEELAVDIEGEVDVHGQTPSGFRRRRGPAPRPRPAGSYRQPSRRS